MCNVDDIACVAFSHTPLIIKFPFDRIRISSKYAIPWEVSNKVTPENTPEFDKDIAIVYGPRFSSRIEPVESYTPIINENLSVLNIGYLYITVGIIEEIFNCNNCKAKAIVLIILAHSIVTIVWPGIAK